MDRLPWGKITSAILRYRGRGLRGRQDRRWCVGRRGWAAVWYVRMVRAQHIIMTDWVGCVNKVPRVALTINLDAEGRMDMNAHLPHVRRNNDLLLPAPYTEIQSLGNVGRITVV